MVRSSILKKFESILNWRPLVVGTLTGKIELSKQLEEARFADVDIIEVRLDTFPLTVIHPLLKAVRRTTPQPLLLTLRSHYEGGEPRFQKRLSNRTRSALIKDFLTCGDLVDIEIRAKSVARQLTKFAHLEGIPVIHSFHDFKKCPTPGFLDKLARFSIQLKGDFFKTAVMVKNANELRKYLSWGVECNHPRPVLIAMGKPGMASRTMGYCFGSTMTFGHLGCEAAPGQIKAKDLMKAIKNIFQPPSR